ncbi:MAG: hypothetical protein ACE5LU_06250, partial [Anaerolineae bacterium]
QPRREFQPAHSAGPHPSLNPSITLRRAQDKPRTSLGTALTATCFATLAATAKELAERRNS